MQTAWDGWFLEVDSQSIWVWIFLLYVSNLEIHKLTNCWVFLVNMGPKKYQMPFEGLVIYSLETYWYKFVQSKDFPPQTSSRLTTFLKWQFYLARDKRKTFKHKVG
jgi:hypothetical protein